MGVYSLPLPRQQRLRLPVVSLELAGHPVDSGAAESGCRAPARCPCEAGRFARASCFRGRPEASSAAVLSGTWAGDGSDGTRTRDLRRDRPSRAPRRPATNASERHICRAFQLWSQAGTAWLSQSSNRRLGHEWATRSCLHGQRSGWRTREIACAKTRIVFSFPSHRRYFVRADALALVRARPDASPRHAGAGGACLSSRRRPSRINPAVPSAA
jgi:hypothetical protein